MAEVMDLRELDDLHPDVRTLVRLLDAWSETYGDDAPPERRWKYAITPVGLESVFAVWLREHLGLLAQFGYPIDTTSVRQEVRLRDGLMRADFVCRVREDCGSLQEGDWLVIENKATMADVAALDQLQGYVDATRIELAHNEERVVGLLLADGVTVRTNERLMSSALGYLSLSALGYRDHLYLADVPVVEVEPDPIRLEDGMVEPLPELMTDLPGRPDPAAADDVRASAANRVGPWTIEGGQYGNRSAADRALAASLGAYTREDWEAAQRAHGLR